MNIKSKTISVFQITLTQLDNAYLNQVLREKNQQSPPEFFRHKAVILDLTALPYLPSATDLKRIKALFAEHHFTVVGVEAPQLPMTSLLETDLAYIHSGNSLTPPAPPKPTEPRAVPTQIIQKNIRSGEQIVAKNSDLIIIGNVNDGGEVHADGNIIVLGRLNGRAFAGINGNKSALIYTEQLNAQLISIAGHYQSKEQFANGMKLERVIVLLDSEQNLKIQSHKTIQ